MPILGVGPEPGHRGLVLLKCAPEERLGVLSLAADGLGVHAAVGGRQRRPMWSRRQEMSMKAERKGDRKAREVTVSAISAWVRDG